MPTLQKIIDLKRLNYSKRIRVMTILLRKKSGLKLSVEDEEELEFFDCLRLLDGFIIDNRNSLLTLSLAGIYRQRTIYLRIGSQSSDVLVFKQVICWGEYKTVIQAYRDYFHSDAATIIDAGGNIGLTSLYFAAHFKNAIIVCVEPDTGNFDLLTANLSQQNVTCIRGAVWNRNCQLQLVNDFRDKRSWSSRVEETQDDIEDTIPAYSIMHIREQNNFRCIDILKMDIEGAEKELFSSPNPDFLNYTKCIALEIHDEFNCRDTIYQCLTNNGFIHFNTGELTIGINKKFLS